MEQREFFSRGKSLKVAKRTFIDRRKEEPVVQQILDGLRAHGIICRRIRERIVRCWKCGNFNGQPSDSGVPDIVGFVRIKGPRFSDEQTWIVKPLFVEVKRPKGGVVRDAQIEFLNQALEADAVACIARDWSDVAAELRRHGIAAAA